MTASRDVAARPPTGLARTREVSRPEGADEQGANLVAARLGPVTADLASATGHSDRLVTVPAVDSVLAAPGQPLDGATRRLMESRLRHDLGTVRIHSGPTADAAARSLGAVAFTQGPRVVLGSSAPPPSTTAGLQLLAHELTHTVQSRAEGPVSPLRRALKTPAAVEPSLAPGPEAPALVLPPDLTERIIHRLEQLVLASDDPQQDQEGAQKVAEYLVVTEQLDRSHVTALFGELQARYPGLMRQVAFGGHVFHELRKLGVVDLAASVLWYLGETVVDTLAGDFVEDPTALAIVLRTLLSLIPGVDQAADVEDLLGNLFHGVTDPKKLLTIGWWFAVVLTLIGLFPSFGSAVKGAAKLTVKGMGKVSGTAVDMVSSAFRRLLGAGWMSVDMARAGIAELLAKASVWGPWAITKFGEFLELAITHLSALASSALASLLDTLATMKKLAAEWMPKAIEEAKRVFGRTGDELADSADDLDEVTQAIARRGRNVDPVEVQRRVAAELDPANPATAELLRRNGATPDQSASRDVLNRLVELRGSRLMQDIVDQTAVVDTAFRNPVAFADAARRLQERVVSFTPAQIAQEAERLAGLGVRSTLQREIAAYVLAIRQEAAAAGRGVVEIVTREGSDVAQLVRGGDAVPVPAPGGVIDHDAFMDGVIRTGDMIVDYALLRDPHSAITHALHDMVADSALRAAGHSSGAAGYRALLGRLQDLGNALGDRFTHYAVPEEFSAGTAFWVSTYDAVGGIAQPEVLGPALRRALALPAEGVL